MSSQETQRKLMERFVRNLGGELRKDRSATQLKMERGIRRLVKKEMRRQIHGNIIRMFDKHQNDIDAMLSKHAKDILTISTKIPWINKALDTISRLESDMAEMRHDFEKIARNRKGNT